MDEFPGEFGWHFETDNHSHWPGFSSLSKHSFPPYIFVKTLHLISVTCLTSEAVSSMVSKCLFLESLTIKECPGLQTLLIHTGHNFHYLTVLNCLELKSLHIKAPDLQKFQYSGLPGLNMNLCLVWKMPPLILEEAHDPLVKVHGLESFRNSTEHHKC